MLYVIYNEDSNMYLRREVKRLKDISVRVLCKLSDINTTMKVIWEIPESLNMLFLKLL